MTNKKAFVLVSIAFIAACAQQPKPTKPDTPEATISCKDPRPEICTREYRPVCATKDTGIRCVKAPCASTEFKTFGNACSACANPKVINYSLGKCKEASK